MQLYTLSYLLFHCDFPTCITRAGALIYVTPALLGPGGPCGPVDPWGPGGPCSPSGPCWPFSPSLPGRLSQPSRPPSRSVRGIRDAAFSKLPKVCSSLALALILWLVLLCLTPGTDVVYTGRAGGSSYNNPGGGVEKLCCHQIQTISMIIDQLVHHTIPLFMEQNIKVSMTHITICLVKMSHVLSAMLQPELQWCSWCHVLLFVTEY